MQAFIFRKQFPFGQLQDTEFRQELQDSVPTQKSMPVMQQLLHKISRLEGTVSEISVAVDTQSDVILETRYYNFQSKINNLEQELINKSDECQSLLQDNSKASLQNQELFTEFNQLSAINSKTLSQNLLLTSQNEEIRKSAISNEHSQKTQIAALHKTIDGLQLQVQEVEKVKCDLAKKALIYFDENASFERKCESFSDKLSIAESQCTVLNGCIKGLARTIEKLEVLLKINSIQQQYHQTLRDFALEIKGHCKGCPLISAEAMHDALFNKRYDAVYSFAQQHGLTTIDSIINCSVSHLTWEQCNYPGQYHTLDALNSLGQYQYRPPPRRQQRKGPRR